MKRNSLFTKIAALMLCVMMVIGCLPVSAFAANITEGEMDVMETTVDLSVLGDSEDTGDNLFTLYSGRAIVIYNWTAIGKGTLSITMPQYIGWSYSLKVGAADAVTGSYADGNTIEATVAEGEAVALTVTYNGTTPSMEVNVQAAFTAAEGTSAENPIMFYNYGQYEYTIGAGETVYVACDSYRELNGTMTFASEGNISGKLIDIANISAGSSFEEVIFAPEYAEVPAPLYFYITNNDAEAETVVTVTYAEPVGTLSNPIEMNVGTEEVPGEQTNTGNGVHYSFVNLGADGTLYVEVSGDSVWYQLQNYSTSVVNDSKTTAGTDSIAVAQYDKAILIIDGDATIKAWFVETPVVEPTPVAEVNGDQFYTVADALNAATSGKTVTMIADSDESDATLIIKPGVTLNLGSYSLYAEYVIGLNGSYVIADYDSSKAETGKLYVKQGNISLGSNSSAATDTYGANYYFIPIWNGDHYFISAARIENNYKVTPAADKNSLSAQFVPTFKTVVRTLMREDGDNLDNNGISLIAVATYVEGGLEITKEYFVPNALQAGTVASSIGGLSFNMTNCNSYEGLEIHVSIVSETGVIISSSTYTH